VQERWTVLTVAVAGSALVIGFFGEKFFGLPPSVALAPYIVSHVAGGYDVAREALPALFRGKFDIDLLMIAALGATSASPRPRWAPKEASARGGPLAPPDTRRYRSHGAATCRASPFR